MQKENKIKTKYNKKVALFVELTIWFLFLGLIILGISAYNSYVHENFNRYQLFLQDIDGIIVGSPVKMLGITVGYVKHLKPINDNVFVDFIITEKGMKIPKGSRITVEFYGLGGSKSLEIYPPNMPITSDTPSIIIQQPRRLGAAFGLLDDMFEKITQIIYKCTSFTNEFENKKHIKEPINRTQQKEFLNVTDQWIDLTQKKLDKINNRQKRYE